MSAPPRLVTPERRSDDVGDTTLRPQRLADFVGQQQARANLQIFIDAARKLDGHISAYTTELPPEVMLDEARAGLHYVELALRLGLAHDEELAAQLW